MSRLVLPTRNYYSRHQKAAWSLGSAAWIFAMFALAMLLKGGAQ